MPRIEENSRQRIVCDKETKKLKEKLGKLFKEKDSKTNQRRHEAVQPQTSKSSSGKAQKMPRQSPQKKTAYKKDADSSAASINGKFITKKTINSAMNGNGSGKGKGKGQMGKKQKCQTSPNKSNKATTQSPNTSKQSSNGTSSSKKNAKFTKQCNKREASTKSVNLQQTKKTKTNQFKPSQCYDYNISHNPFNDIYMDSELEPEDYSIDYSDDIEMVMDSDSDYEDPMFYDPQYSEEEEDGDSETSNDWDDEFINSSEYSTEDSDYSYNWENVRQDFLDQDDNYDEDYKLPPGVQEDLIIHHGLAEKRDLKLEDKIHFNSDTEEAQIIEMETTTTVKRIEQPKAYRREELQKLKINTNTVELIALKMSRNKVKGNESYEVNNLNSDDCPKLIPIPHNVSTATQDGRSSNSFDSCNEDSDEGDPFGHEWSINEKYLGNQGDEESDCEVSRQEEEAMINISQVDIIKVKQQFSNENCTLLNRSKNLDRHSTSSYEKWPSFVATSEGECTILTASVVDDAMNETNSLEPEVESTEKSFLKKVQQSSTTPQVCHKNSGRYNGKFFCNAVDDNKVLILLRQPVHFYGTVRLTVLLGSIEVYGYSPPLNKELEIFSPRGCSAVGIACVSSTQTPPASTKNSLNEILKMYGNKFVVEHLKNLLDSFNAQTDAILLLSRNTARKRLQQQFHKFMDQNVFPNMQNLNMERPLYTSEYRLRCMINTLVAEANCVRIPPEWRNLILNNESKILIAGGKAVGKSTLMRFLINKHLPQFERILLIDLDIGQPEIFVPQTVSCCLLDQPLIGPGFMLNLQPDKAYAVGHTNVLMCPYKYVEAVKNLIKFCNEQARYQGIPWLINTMGYNKGFGLELLSVITQGLKLTDLIQIQSSKEMNNYDCLLYSRTLFNVPRKIFEDGNERRIAEEGEERSKYCFHVWQSLANEESRYNREWGMSAKDMRYANVLSRLSACLTGSSEWLTDCKPLKARLSDLKLINLTEAIKCTNEELVKVIEANLIYLCHYTQCSEPLECFGIGVVRAVDYHLNEVYLVPAMPLKSLAKVNCLAIGDMPLPSTLFTNQGSRVRTIAPFVYNTIDAKASKAIKHFCRRPNDTHG